MPRVAGQIDVLKNEAILDAAIEVMSEQGLGAPLAEIARRACVSKQTIYNHYGSKAELARAMSERRAHEVAEVLDAPGAIENPAETLTGCRAAADASRSESPRHGDLQDGDAGLGQHAGRRRGDL